MDNGKDASGFDALDDKAQAEATTPDHGDRVKEAGKLLADTIALHCVDGPMKQKALMDVRSATLFAIASIFH